MRAGRGSLCDDAVFSSAACLYLNVERCGKVYMESVCWLGKF